MLSKLFKTKQTPRNTKSLNFNFLPFTDYNSENTTTANSYQRNVIVYRCVNLITQSASHVPWILYKNKGSGWSKINSHPLYKLLEHPNAFKAGADFFAEVIGSLLLFGDCYILATGKNSETPKELHLLPTQQVEVVMQDGILAGYRHRHAKGENFYSIDKWSSRSRILHLKTYNPSDSVYGLSCLEAASLPIELHNFASKWNSSLLRNGARPSGALIMKEGGGYLSDEQFERLKEQLYEKYSGASNSGKPLLLEGGLDWKEMSISPKDMDFIESKNSAAREIALAFGVPPQLLGISGDNTYSNMQEARLALWEETLIPLLDKIGSALTHWFADWYSESIVVDFDRDSISALTEKRQNVWAKIAASSFMTINEKRVFAGLSPIKGGDVIVTEGGDL